MGWNALSGHLWLKLQGGRIVIGQSRGVEEVEFLLI